MATRPPILIVISTFNRRDLTGISLDSIKRNKSPLSDVLVLDDASTDYSIAWLNHWRFKVQVSGVPVGVGLAAFRRYQEFVLSGYDYLCALDNDVLLGWHFDTAMLRLFQLANDDNLTVLSGYLSTTQKVLAAFPDYYRVDCIGGISHFTDRSTALRILDGMENKWQHPWDANVSRILSQIVAPKRSLVQHLGIHGTGVNGISQDVAVNFVGDGRA